MLPLSCEDFSVAKAKSAVMKVAGSVVCLEAINACDAHSFRIQIYVIYFVLIIKQTRFNVNSVYQGLVPKSIFKYDAVTVIV